MSDVTSTTSRGPSRRAVVRTAANAAWAVPAIQIATSAPAFAATSNRLALYPASTFTWTASTSTGIATVRVQNDDANTPTSAVEVKVTFPTQYVRQGATSSQGQGADKTVTVTGTTSGWTPSAVTYSGSGAARTGSITFTRAAIAANTTLTLQFTFASDSKDASSTPSLPVTVTSAGFTPDSGSISKV